MDKNITLVKLRIQAANFFLHYYIFSLNIFTLYDTSNVQISDVINFLMYIYYQEFSIQVVTGWLYDKMTNINDFQASSRLIKMFKIYKNPKSKKQTNKQKKHQMPTREQYFINQPFLLGASDSLHSADENRPTIFSYSNDSQKKRHSYFCK